VPHNTFKPSRKTVLRVGAAESHRWIRQPALQNRQRIHEAVASFAGLLRQRLQYNRIAFALGFETRVRGCLHQFRWHKNFARVIDLDNHRKLLINDIRFGGLMRRALQRRGPALLISKINRR
jgi:hypothetical protein